MSAQDQAEACSCVAAQPFVNWRVLHHQLIEATVAELGTGALDEAAHWDLIDEMKGALGADAANASSDDAADQEEALNGAESWVSSELSNGSLVDDVAMARWLDYRGGHPTVLAWLKANFIPN